MAIRQISLQDHFLNSVRRSKASCAVFLVKGVKLQGAITWFDAFSLLLRREAASQLVYKHAVSTIAPQKMPSDLIGELSSKSFAHDPRSRSLQDVFLSAAAREAGELTLFLVNGVMLQGRIAAFDQFSLLLQRDDQYQLVYKHAVSTLQPVEPLTLGDPSSDQDEDEDEGGVGPE